MVEPADETIVPHGIAWKLAQFIVMENNDKLSFEVLLH